MLDRDFDQLFPHMGSKKAYVRDLLSDYVPEQVSNYSEPFLGSGSVFTFLAKRGYFDSRSAVLSDGDYLISGLFNALRNNLMEVLDEYLRLAWDWDKAAMVEALKPLYRADGDFEACSDPAIAARFYICKCSAVLGIIRRPRTRRYFSASLRKGFSPLSDHNKGRLLYFADLLNKVGKSGGLDLSHAYIQDIAPRPSTFAFLDPPYVPEGATYYAEYIANGGQKLQEETVRFAHQAVSAGGAYFACNSLALEHELYGDNFAGFKVPVPRGSGNTVYEKLLVDYSIAKDRDKLKPALDGAVWRKIQDPGWRAFDTAVSLGPRMIQEVMGISWSDHMEDERLRISAAVAGIPGPNTQI